MTITFRPATHDDVDAIVAIEEASFNDPWSAASFAGYLAESNRARARLTVALQDDRIVGYTVLLFAGDDADLANIAVAPRERGKGTGRALLGEALAEVRARGVHDVYLEVRESNARAIAMYESAGFAEAGRRRRYYTDPVEDARVLRLRISR